MLVLFNGTVACISIPRFKIAAWNLSFAGFPQLLTFEVQIWSRFKRWKFTFWLSWQTPLQWKGAFIWWLIAAHSRPLSSVPKTFFDFLHFLVCLDRTLVWINHPSEYLTALPAHLKHQHALTLCPCAQSVGSHVVCCLLCSACLVVHVAVLWCFLFLLSVLYFSFSQSNSGVAATKGLFGL